MKLLDEINQIKFDKKTLRETGLTMAVCLFIIVGIYYWRHQTWSWYLMLAAAIFGLLGLAAPLALKPFQKVWMTLALLMGWLMSRVILTVFFYLVITPIGFLSRLFGRKFLSLRPDDKSASYWEKHAYGAVDRRTYENQY